MTRPFGWNILLQRTFTNRFVKLYKYVIEYSSTEWSHKRIYVVIHTCNAIYMAVSMYTTNMCKDVLYHYYSMYLLSNRDKNWHLFYFLSQKERGDRYFGLQSNNAIKQQQKKRIICQNKKYRWFHAWSCAMNDQSY